GFIVSQFTGVIMLTGGATLPVGAALLTLSSIGLPQRLHMTVRRLLVVEAVLLVAVLGLGVTAIYFPRLVPYVPAANSPAALATLAAGLLLFGLLALRAVRTFLLTRRVSDLAVAVGIMWLAVSLVAALTLTYAQLGWWLGHGLELDGILLVGIPVAPDLVLAEETFLGSHVRALTLSLAQRDDYTEQHTRRVALRAVQVGELLGMSRKRLRELATGGLVHDIGKLAVPDSILKKPGPLDDDEYDVIKRHPEHGMKLLEEIGGFSDAVRRLVRD